jgi:hypothetical protein
MLLSVPSATHWLYSISHIFQALEELKLSASQWLFDSFSHTLALEKISHTLAADSIIGTGNLHLAP